MKTSICTILIILLLPACSFASDWQSFFDLQPENWPDFIENHPTLLNTTIISDETGGSYTTDETFYTGLTEIVMERDFSKLEMAIGIGVPAGLYPGENLKQDFSALPLILLSLSIDWEEGVFFLFENGASVHEMGSFGQNTLYYAVKNNNLAIAEYLLRNGTESQIRIEAGHRDGGDDAYQLAVRSGFTEMAALLREYGALDNDKILELDARIGTETANIYPEPSFTGLPLMVMNRDDEIRIQRRSGRPMDHQGSRYYWFYCQSADTEGWIYGKSVRFRIPIFSVFD